MQQVQRRVREEGQLGLVELPQLRVENVDATARRRVATDRNGCERSGAERIAESAASFIDRVGRVADADEGGW